MIPFWLPCTTPPRRLTTVEMTPRRCQSTAAWTLRNITTWASRPAPKPHPTLRSLLSGGNIQPIIHSSTNNINWTQVKLHSHLAVSFPRAPLGFFPGPEWRCTNGESLPAFLLKTLSVTRPTTTNMRAGRRPRLEGSGRRQSLLMRCSKRTTLLGPY